MSKSRKPSKNSHRHGVPQKKKNGFEISFYHSKDISHGCGYTSNTWPTYASTVDYDW